jgi:hypothetical protein
LENLSATNLALSATDPVHSHGREAVVICVNVKRADIAERFATCMKFFESLAYHDLGGDPSLENAALNLSLLRLRLTRWSTMVHFEGGTESTLPSYSEELHIATREEETAVVNVLKKMESAFKYVERQCHRKSDTARDEPDKPLPRLLREIDRLSESRAPKGTWFPDHRRVSKMDLGPVFQDWILLRRFLNDIDDFTSSLMHLFRNLPGPQENKHASRDVDRLLDWLQFASGIESANVDELLTLLVQAAQEVDPSFKLALEQGRHVFGGHTYDFVKATGRVNVIMGTPYHDGDDFRGVHRYGQVFENTVAYDSARIHMGNNYGQVLFER